MSVKHARRAGGIREMPRRARRANPWQRIVAVFGTMLLGISAIVGTGVAAQAATPGIDISIMKKSDGTPVGPGDSVPEGTALTLQLSYDALQPIDGKSVTINLGPGVTVGTVPAGNAAIDSAVNNGDGTVTINFKNPIPDHVAQGVYSLDFTLNNVDGDTNNTVSWNIGDDTGGVTFVIEDKVTPPTEVNNGYQKSVSPGNLDSFVEVEQDPANDGYYKFKGLRADVVDQELTYTLVLDSKDARTNYVVSDVLAAGLGYVPDSFTAKVTTYNPTATNDIAFAPTVTPGAPGATSSFTGTLASVPANSHIVITYKAKVRDVALIEGLLQAAFDTRAGGAGHFTGAFSTSQQNTASFGADATRSGSVRFQGNVPGPCPSCTGVFAKTGSWTSIEVDADEDGTLTPAAAIDYTLTANLDGWDGRNPDFRLADNVVIEDTLPSQAAWNTAASDFVTSTGMVLAAEATCPALRTDFQADAYAGKYCVNGQVLWVNIGKNAPPASKIVTVVAKANLLTVAGLATDGTKTTILDSTAYVLPNSARFFTSASSSVERSFTSYPIVLPAERDGGLNDRSAFAKTADDDVVAVQPGETATVDYTFTVNTAKDSIDPLTSTIVDYVDTDVFDISDLGAIAIHGSYRGATLTAADFELDVNDDGGLVIVLSTSGKTKVAAEDAGGVLTIHLPLTTHELTAQQTFEITNRATLFGSDGDPLYWSEDGSEATSYGDEAELRKRLYNPVSDSWTDNINAELDENGELVNDVFVYRIQFIPRGGYNNVVIYDVVDALPAATEFLGFVTEDDLAGEHPVSGPVDMGGNIEASYDDGAGTVTISQKAGTRLNAGAEIAVYFAVRVTDVSDVIVNRVGNSEATITPFGAPSIDIEKWDATDESSPRYDGTGALLNDGFPGDRDSAETAKSLKAGATLPIRFTISNDGLDHLTDVVVSDTLTSGTGAIADLSCDFSTLDPEAPSTGTTWAGPFLIGTQFSCTGTLPALEAGDTHADLAKVTARGILSGTEVEDEDEWHGRVLEPSIDIEKWTEEGGTGPLYNEAGELTNDGYAGDFDSAKGKKLEVGKDQLIRFTISNDGPEALIDVKVGDVRTGGVGDVQNVVCVFPDESTGLEWAGPFAVGTQFQCTGTLPGLNGGESHSDRATVTAIGIDSGIVVDDADEWHGYAEAPATANTGAQFQWWIGASGLALLLAGGALVLVRRRTRV